MGTTFGRQVIASFGRTVRASASDDTEYKVAGISLDWNTVAAVGTDTVLPDGTTILNGRKGLVFGTVLALIRNGTIQTVTLTAATGGYWTAHVPIGSTPPETAHIAYNAAATDVQTAFEALTNVGVGNVLVTGGAGGPYTLQFRGALKGVVVGLIVVTDATTGTGHAVVAAITNVGQATTNWYGPADTSQTDGRQTLGVGETFVLDETVLEVAPIGITGHMTDHPPVIEGGTVWKSRLQVGGTNQPTLAQVLAVLPRLKILEDI